MSEKEIIESIANYLKVVVWDSKFDYKAMAKNILGLVNREMDEPQTCKNCRTCNCKHQKQDVRGLYYCDVPGDRIHSRKDCGFFTIICPDYDRETRLSRTKGGENHE